MIRSHFAVAAILLGLAVEPAAGADLHHGYFVPAPPPLVEPSPFYLVDQGPRLSGPGIMITEIGITRTDLRQSYPFIGSYHDFAHVHWRRKPLRVRY
jgi:hypothetical protein